MSRSGRRRVLRAVVWAAAGLLVTAGLGLWWLLIPSAVDDALFAAVQADPDLVVTDHDEYVALTPAHHRVDRGVVFYPGSRADAAAYLPTWAPIVEGTGIAVFVAKMPLGLSVLDDDAAEAVLAAEPGIREWWVGGHSMGGITATRYLAEHPRVDVEGVILWAAFPDRDVSLTARAGLRVLTVTGERDGIVSTGEVRRHQRRLPVEARLVEIEGMEHGQFGSYDSTFGEGNPAISDEVATERLGTVTSTFLLAGR